MFFPSSLLSEITEKSYRRFQCRISEIKLSIFCLPLSWSQREDKDLWDQGPSIIHPALQGQLDSDQRLNSHDWKSVVASNKRSEGDLAAWIWNHGTLKSNFLEITVIAGPKAPVESENQRAVTRQKRQRWLVFFRRCSAIIGLARWTRGGQSGSRRFSAAPFISADRGHTWSDPRKLFRGRNSSTQVSLHP